MVDNGDRASAVPIKQDNSYNDNSGGSIFGDNDFGGDNGFVPDCAMCNGTGRCQKCGDDGYVWSYAMDNERLNCSKCSTSGNCWYCGGSGKRN